VRQTEKGKDYISGEKAHKKVTKDIAKKVQAAFGAKTAACGSDQEKWKLAVGQILNHYYGWHVTFTITTVDEEDSGWVEDGGWEQIDVTSMCESLGLFVEDEHKGKYVNASSHDEKWHTYISLAGMSVAEKRQHCPYIPRTFAREYDCAGQKTQREPYLHDSIYHDGTVMQGCSAPSRVRNAQTGSKPCGNQHSSSATKTAT
jgi:hypothetical protein